MERDLYAIAKSLAREQDCSVSAAVTNLLRGALLSARKRRPAAARRNGLPVVRGRQPFTSADVYRLDTQSA
jgi:hypothetical protein